MIMIMLMIIRILVWIYLSSARECWMLRIRMMKMRIDWEIFVERDSGRVRELLECPVCLEEMRPPKKIFQVSQSVSCVEKKCPISFKKFLLNNRSYVKILSRQILRQVLQAFAICIFFSVRMGTSSVNIARTIQRSDPAPPAGSNSGTEVKLFPTVRSS